MTDFFENILIDMNLSSWSISSISISDFIDILIVAVLIYKIMVWIKETRAWSLFKGIVVILLISIAAYILRLHTILWVMQNTLGVGLIAIIVLFQPELRKALEQLGKGKIVSPFSAVDHRRISHRSIEEIVNAVGIMAAHRTGALILIEQDVALGDHETTGIVLDAVVTSQLLVNIFTNKTPLHDGAVIIRDNRVAAATCILPLTELEIGHEYGTRHRAAVGASEVSDAIVIVVSEETGNISIARGGKLQKGITKVDLRKILIKNFELVKRRLFLRKEQKNVAENSKKD